MFSRITQEDINMEKINSFINPIQASTPYPSLSTTGWIRSMNEKVDQIFADYMVNQHNQTVLFLGSVRSLPYTVKQYYSQPYRLSDQIREDLETILSPFFDFVHITVDYKKHWDEDTQQEIDEYDYTINMTIRQGEYQWKQFKSLHMKDSKVEQIAGINYNGDRYSLAS